MQTPYASQYDQERLRASADIIEEVDGLVTYLGFCIPGTTLTSQAQWSIMKIVEGAVLPKITTFQWANGLCSYSLVWDNRAAYAYSFHKF